uniref:F-box domain-containing protein n=1 Tax=Syphacia muris TaxID=451379 RepID=A0A0N5AC98_9BILA
MASEATTSYQASAFSDDDAECFSSFLSFYLGPGRCFNAAAAGLKEILALSQRHSRVDCHLGMCPAYKRLKMREVCRHWKEVHDKYFVCRSKFKRLKITANDHKIRLTGIKRTCEKVVEFRKDRNVLVYLLRSTELVPKGVDYQGGTVVLENEAASDEVLHLIEQQEWNIRKIELHGMLVNITNDVLYNFIEKQNSNPALCNIREFYVKHGTINEGFVSDRLISALHKTGMIFDVELVKNCIAHLTRTFVSDAVLPMILQPDMYYCLRHPFACKISIQGIKRSLETFFATDWTKVRYPERYSVANNDADAAARSVCCYYRCELKLQASAKFNLASFTGMKIKGIMEYIYCEHGIHLDGRHLRPGAIERGEIMFLRQRMGGRLMYAKIVLF